MYFLGQAWKGFRDGFLREAACKDADGADTQCAHWSSQEVCAPPGLMLKVRRQSVIRVLWCFGRLAWKKKRRVSASEMAQNRVCLGFTALL